MLESFNALLTYLVNDPFLVCSPDAKLPMRGYLSRFWQISTLEGAWCRDGDWLVCFAKARIRL